MHRSCFTYSLGTEATSKGQVSLEGGLHRAHAHPYLSFLGFFSFTSILTGVEKMA